MRSTLPTNTRTSTGNQSGGSAHIRRWDDDLVELRRELQNKPIWRTGSRTDGPRFDLKVEKRSDARRDCSVVAAELVAHNTGVIGTVPRVYPDNQAPARHGPETYAEPDARAACCVVNGFVNERGATAAMGYPRRTRPIVHLTPHQWRTPSRPGFNRDIPQEVVVRVRPITNQQGMTRLPHPRDAGTPRVQRPQRPLQGKELEG